MEQHHWVVRPRPGRQGEHDLVAADGMPMVRLEVTADRSGGRVVPTTGAVLTFERASAVARTWHVADEAGPVGEIIKPSAVRERFQVVRGAAPPADVTRVSGPARRRWEVGRDRASWATVVQGVARRRWHDVRLVVPPFVRPEAADERLLLIVAWIVALVDTPPASGLAGLRRSGPGAPA